MRDVTAERFGAAESGTAGLQAAESQAAESEVDTLRWMYAEHGGRLRSIALRFTQGDRHWAEDVVQETLLRAWRNIDALRTGGTESLLPWLSTVARRVVIDDLRRRRARPVEVSDAPLEYLAGADEVDRMLDTVVVTEALQALSPAHREVLVQTYYLGRTVQQAADTLGLPVGTVKSRVYYGLRALQLALRERGIDG
jgi:RNA polymerase sigma-70 factor (ECF subfamily)